MSYRLDVAFPPVERLPEHIAPEIIALIPAVTAAGLQALPLGLMDGHLEVAMTPPMDWPRLEALRLVTGWRIQTRTIAPALLEEGLRRWYPHEPADPRPPEPAFDAIPVRVSSPGSASAGVDAEGMASVIDLVDRIIVAAVQKKASDIHIEPFDQELRIRYRLDGFLQTQPGPPYGLRAAIVSRIKVLSDLDIAEKRRPQDGTFRLTIQGRAIDFRVSTTPTIYGEKAVLRILDREAVALDLEGLGLSSVVLSSFQQMIARPYGLILVTGPTGSGKTTTLYAGLNAIRAEGINILTVEDPIEYNLAGINQTQAHAEIGLSFAQVLRSFLRQDPNVILVGEIRDRETAAIAIQAALTGHLVLSSLHTNDAAGAVGRLLDMGMEPFLVASSLHLVVAQRLVRKICRFCRSPVALTEAEGTPLGLVGETSVWAGAGCAACYGTGYQGRTALAEAMVVSAALSEGISRRASSRELVGQALLEGMRTLREDGIAKIREGITTASEVIRETVG